ncbi:MAG: class I SAM-dependent RNA methyltransferase [Chloroflexi bacterium]|nr:class I SAM-dependent RNA methyltransferase [Chloroflexota bacterium]
MPDFLELTIDDIAAGGRGLAFYKGKPIFVPYTIPGERVRARLVIAGDRSAAAEGVELLEASADRVYPLCAHFGPGRCGRCQWQHIDTPAQIALKYDIVADQLSRLGGLSDAEIERALRMTLPAPEPWGFNHHITYTVTDDLRLGLPSTEEGRIIAIDECPITHPDLMAFGDQLDLDLTGIRRVRLELGSDGAVMVVLWPRTEEDAPELEADFPASVNIILPDNEPMNLIGDSHTRYQVGGRWFRATAGSAFRPNVAGVGVLAATVRDLLDLRAGDAVLDLYAGVGVFGAFAAETAALVAVVESYPPAATDADENLAEFEHVEVIEGAVEAVLPSLEEHYDAAIVDPSSAGLSDEVIGALAEHAPSRLVYVSGDPASRARDAKRLRRAGYVLSAAQPVDLAPQSYYVDIAARFDRDLGAPREYRPPRDPRTKNNPRGPRPDRRRK